MVEVAEETQAEESVKYVHDRVMNREYPMVASKGDVNEFVVTDLYLGQDAFLELREAFWKERNSVSPESVQWRALNQVGEEVIGTFAEIYPLPEF